MATAVNPIVVGPVDNMPELVRVQVAASQTYKKGTPMKLAAGQLTICSDDDIPYGQTAVDVATAATAATYEWVYRWDTKTRLEIYVCTDGTASAIGTANKGLCYDLEMIGTAPTEIGYLDLGATTDKLFRVVDLAAEYEPLKNAAADSPGKCVVQVMVVQTT